MKFGVEVVPRPRVFSGLHKKPLGSSVSPQSRARQFVGLDTKPTMSQGDRGGQVKEQGKYE
jgi:hypothetical protein